MKTGFEALCLISSVNRNCALPSSLSGVELPVAAVADGLEVDEFGMPTAGCELKTGEAESVVDAETGAVAVEPSAA